MTEAQHPWRCRLGWHAWLAVPVVPPPYPPRDLTALDYAGFRVVCQRGCGTRLSGRGRGRERWERVIDQQWGVPRDE